MTPSEAAGLALLGGPALAAVLLAGHDGGYFITSWGPASMLLWGLLAGGVVLLRPRMGGPAGLAALGGLLALAAWQLASSWWAGDPAAAVAAGDRTLLYAAVLGLGLAGTTTARSLRLASWLALGVAAVVGAWGGAARLLPDHVGGDGFQRLNTPVSYWNGLGALMAVGVVTGVGLAGTSTARPWARAVAVAPVPALTLVLYFTLSRGAFLALAAGLLVLLAIGPDRLETLAAAVVGLAAAAPVVLMARDRDLASLGSEGFSLDLGARREVLAGLGVWTVAAVAVTWVLAAGLRRMPAGGRRGLGVVVGVVLAGLVVTGAALHPPAGGPVAWADRQFDAFRSFEAGGRTDASLSSQLTTAAGSGRWQNWSVAAGQFTDAPLAGTGAGDYRLRWAADRDIGLYVTNAHSLYLEVLGESGLIGLLLLLLPLAAGALVLTAVTLRGPPVRRDVAVAAAGAFTVALHAAGDWDWQLPTVMIPGVLLGGALLAAGADSLGWTRRTGVWLPVAACVAAAAAVLLVAGPAASQANADRAREQARDGRLAAALVSAGEAVDADPAATGPRRLQGFILNDLGRPGRSDAAFAAALRRSPGDWEVMADWAAALIARGDRAAARPLVRRASALNPLEGRLAVMRSAVGLPDRPAR
jgi:O-antigen ligase